MENSVRLDHIYLPNALNAKCEWMGVHENLFNYNCRCINANKMQTVKVKRNKQQNQINTKHLIFDSIFGQHFLTDDTYTFVNETTQLDKKKWRGKKSNEIINYYNNETFCYN